jgi:hypothetical protein
MLDVMLRGPGALVDVAILAVLSSALWVFLLPRLEFYRGHAQNLGKVAPAAV